MFRIASLNDYICCIKKVFSQVWDIVNLLKLQENKRNIKVTSFKMLKITANLQEKF